MNKKETIRTVLDSIPPEKIEAPNLPVAISVQEARELLRTARDLWPHLKAVGADAAWLDQIENLTEYVPDAEAAWAKVRSQGRTLAERSLTEKAEWLRGELFAATSYALANDEGAQGRLGRIREGEGFADLLQDLRELHGVCYEQKAALARVGFDFAIADAAKEAATELADMRATSVSAKALDESKLERDRAWTALNNVMDNVRAAGLYAFRNDPDKARLAAFRSRHAIARGRRYRRNQPPVRGSAVVTGANAPGASTTPPTTPIR